ncbi:hypothetical protein ACFX2C_026712 [Malus domestica]
MKNDMTAAVVDSLTLSVQCAGSVSNMAQRLFARTRQVESLAAEVISLKQDIRGLKKLDQMQESDGQILLDHQRFVGLFQRHLLPSSSGVVLRNEVPNDQPLMPPPSGVLSSTEALNDHPSVPSLSEALSTAETSPKQPLLEKSKSLSGYETSEYQGAVAYGRSPPSLQSMELTKEMSCY